jgi:hypothetical protein
MGQGIGRRLRCRAALAGLFASRCVPGSPKAVGSNSPLTPSGMRCLSPANRVRIHNGIICLPTPRSVCRSTRKGFGEESARFGPNPKGRGFAGDPLRYKTRQGVQPCLGFCASRLIPQKPRRARRESGSASPTPLSPRWAKEGDFIWPRALRSRANMTVRWDSRAGIALRFLHSERGPVFGYWFSSPTLLYAPRSGGPDGSGRAIV